MTTVGPPGGLTRVSRPSTACTRSVRPARPLDDDPTRDSSAPPRPSSRTTRRSHVALLRARDGGPRGLRVLRHVGQQLGDAEVGDRLDGRRRPRLEGDGELRRDGAAGGQRGERALQPDVERGRVDAPGDVAQLGDGLLGSPVRLVDELAHPFEVDLVPALELLLGHPEAHGQSDQLGLGAVVQVALDPPQRRRRGVDRLAPGLLERAHPGRHGVGAEQGADEEPVHVGEAAHDPGGGEEEDDAEEEDGHPAGEALPVVEPEEVPAEEARDQAPDRWPAPGRRTKTWSTQANASHHRLNATNRPSSAHGTLSAW